VIRAVVFDLDGVLLDSEGVWDDARRQVVEQRGGRWSDGATRAMQGMSSTEWSAYLHEELGVPLEARQIVPLVVDLVLDRYRHALPLLPGACQAVARMADHWPLGLASSSNREVIDEVLALANLTATFRATVSSEEVAKGKPHPDVYLEACRRLGEGPATCAAIEDSGNGIRAAVAAGLSVVAVPDRGLPPSAPDLARADVVLGSLSELTVEVLASLGDRSSPAVADPVDEQEVESFPASDPHADWAGPPPR
jgi:HAD superfamily hydrolase (TIGR01509 family)